MEPYKLKKNECLQLRIDQIKESFEEVQANFDAINEKLSIQREDFSDEIKDNLLEAYSYTNELLKTDIDIFSNKGLTYMLELNHIVLCGKDTQKRFEYYKYIEHSKERFYENIEVVQRWYKNHDESSTLKRSAEVYVGIISCPQLFYEGNHRTGSIIASWILMKRGYPPFILNYKNAVAYFQPSSQIKFTDKRQIHGKLKLPKYKKSFKKFLEECIDTKYISIQKA